MILSFFSSCSIIVVVHGVVKKIYNFFISTTAMHTKCQTIFMAKSFWGRKQKKKKKNE